jgi:hypothetical protein
LVTFLFKILEQSSFLVATECVTDIFSRACGEALFQPRTNKYTKGGNHDETGIEDVCADSADELDGGSGGQWGGTNQALDSDRPAGTSAEFKLILARFGGGTGD